MNKRDKIELVRKNIIDGARLYQREMVGKYFVYIFGEEQFEMYYGIKNFKHLTGADSSLSPEQFYQLATSGHLQEGQLAFNARFPLKIALKKSEGLKSIVLFKQEELFVIKDLKTDTATYPYALTNLDKSLLVVFNPKRVSGKTYYVPKSFRIKDKNIFSKTSSENIFSVDFILSKTDIEKEYSQIEFNTAGKSLDEIRSIIDRA